MYRKMNRLGSALAIVCISVLIFTTVTFVAGARHFESYAAPEKKAIYVLPGFLGSNLYSIEGRDSLLTDKVWVWIPAILDEIKRKTNDLTLSSNGKGVKVRIDRKKDKYGALKVTKPLQRQLKKDFKGEYDVVYFPFNWMLSLDDAVKLLNDDIENKHYNNVVFVAHSTGGLVASAYLKKYDATRSVNFVKKAILIGAPLFGTHISTNAIVNGRHKLIDAVHDEVGKAAKLMGDEMPPVTSLHAFTKRVMRNSPAAYQLLPSQEHLSYEKNVYIDKNTAVKSLPSASMTRYKSALRAQENVNDSMLERLSSFRDDSLGGDIEKMLIESRTEVTAIVGTGQSTIDHFIYDVNKNVMRLESSDNSGDGTVTRYSAVAYDKKDGSRIKSHYFRGIAHSDLVKTKKVLEKISEVIAGDKSKSRSISVADEQSTDEPESNMEGIIRVDVVADTAVGIDIRNVSGETVAAVEEGIGAGFFSEELGDVDLLADDEGIEEEDDDPIEYAPDEPVPDRGDFLYIEQPHEKGTDATLYLTSRGYSMHFSAGSGADIPANLSVKVTSLDKEGRDTATAEYLVTKTGVGGTLLTLDMTETEAAGIQLGALGGNVNGATVIHPTAWTLDEMIVLEDIGASTQAALQGVDVDAGTITRSALTWLSSDSEVATVDDEGQVNAVGFGRATIYAALPGAERVTRSCEVLVPLCAENIQINDIVVQAGCRKYIDPTFDSVDVTQDKIDYAFDETQGIISIADGVVTGLRPGTISVTGKAEGGAEDSFTVTVLPEGATVVGGGGGGGGGSSTNTGNSGGKGKEDDKDDTVGSGSAGGNDLGTFAQDIAVGKIADCAFTGKQVKPVPVVTKGGKRLAVGQDYTVSYGTNKAIGIGKVTVKGIGSYAGERTVQFRIVPKQVLLKTVTAGKGQLIAKWKKSSADQMVTQYQVRYRANGSGVWKVRTVTSQKASLTLTRLRAGKVYQLEIRACKQIGKESFSSPWSLAKASPRVK
ncbi:MAG: fibronectin type III domain-containing protein [Clostridiales Family XIII bacterium]|jgi:pimeloyl-ACP methyl ester carboxylesterase|nr:fibronectin type III domain-containing protein [Clostridiales Family XIII bacterium]